VGTAASGCPVERCSTVLLATLEMVPNERTQTPQFAAGNLINMETKRRSV
jgi:hypothetical protein